VKIRLGPIGVDPSLKVCLSSQVTDFKCLFDTDFQFELALCSCFKPSSHFPVMKNQNGAFKWYQVQFCDCGSFKIIRID
jgi:hypothetical protein